MLNIKNTYENIRLKYNNVTSAYAYNSVVLWTKEWDLTPVILDDLITVEIGTNHSEYFFPCGNKEHIHKYISNLIETKDTLVFKYLSERDAAFLKFYFPGTFSISKDVDSDEYIYSIQEHLTLEGKKYSYCRGHLNHITKNHSMSIKALDYSNDDDIKNANMILTGWRNNRTNEDNVIFNIDDNVLNNGAELGIEAYLIYLDNRPFSIQAGYNIGNGIFDLCLTKEISIISGGSYAAKHLLFKHLFDRYEYINIEEDLGIDGLREAKEIMRPVYKNEMYKAELI